MVDRLSLPTDIRLMRWAASALVAAFVLVGLGSAVRWAARHSAWTLTHITIEGDVAHQNAVTFRAHLASRLTGNFLTLNLAEVKHLFETVPWVRQAVVRRDFPNGLRVTVQEHEAEAWWGEAGSGKLLNRQGEVFEANADEARAEGWPELDGPEGQSRQVLALYRELQGVFGPLDLGIARLELSASGAWKVRLDGGQPVELGRGQPADLLARARAFVATLTQLTQRYGGRAFESADLRYPNGYAVRLRGVTTVTDDKAATPPRKR
jgi:cell division protein FtsQ